MSFFLLQCKKCWYSWPTKDSILTLTPCPQCHGQNVIATEVPAMSSQLTQPAIGGSFVFANQPPRRRLVIALDGLEKQGKTHFALTAPGPLAYQSWDIGDEGVIQKFQSTKPIWYADYGVTVSKADTQEQLMQKFTPEWERCVSDYEMVLKAMHQKTVRSLVKDTSSEEWEALRLARFGKLTQVMPHHYTALNSEYRNLIRKIFDTDGNMILLHKLKAEWTDSAGTGKGNKTGKYVRSGYADTGFLVQVNAVAWRDQDGQFHVTVKDCRQNPDVAGLDLVGPMCNFKTLAMMVFPDSNESDWE